MDELYVNKNGFKCVRTQLAKTAGRDPQEYEQAKKYFSDDAKAMATALGSLKVKIQEYDDA